jgi:hypothetical protein
MKYLILFHCLVFSWNAHAYSNEKSAFTIDINGESNPYKIFSTFVMPNGNVQIKSNVEISIASGEMVKRQNGLIWIIIAPKKSGIYPIKIFDNKKNEIQLNIMVMTPLSLAKGEYLNGYRIGNYPSTPLKGNPIYNKPEGLFEVTKSNQDTRLSPHFTLKQFLCKQGSEYPKYLIVRERLLIKLEYILELVNKNGFKSNSFGFISGYRTPYYNASIQNVQYSRHVYGGAADIIIDNNNDGGMDDLNKDGAVDEMDVRIFYNIVEGEYNKSAYYKFRGGLGFYKKNSNHNGFIHIDVRGWRSRW